MSEFSVFLKNCIKNQNLTLKEVAKLTNQNYSLLSRYIHATRLPKNQHVVKEIAAGLQLNENDTKKLCKYYQQEKIGKDEFEAYKKIKNLLSRLDYIFTQSGALFPKPIYNQTIPLKEGITPLNSQQDIFDCISYSIIYFSKNETVNIKAMMQPHPALNELFVNHPISTQIHLEQIICVDRNNANSSTINLNLLDTILPILCSSIDTEISYYYESINNHINSFTLFPAIIIIGDYLIRFDEKINYGELITVPEIVDFYKNTFMELKQNTAILTPNLNSPMAHTQYLTENENSFTTGYAFHSWPCVGSFLSRDIYEQFLLPELPMRDVLIENLTKTCNYSETQTPQQNVKIFITKEGIEYFLKTGDIVEFPKEYYIPLTKEVRLLIMKRMIKGIKEGWAQIYITKEDFTIPKNIGVIFSSSYLSIKNTTSPNLDTYIIEESSLCSLFINFFNYCVENNYVYPISQTTEIIKDAIRRLL